MFITLKKGDNLNRIVNQFICENEEDLQEIPKNERIFGSMTYIINNQALYIANSKSEWEAVSAKALRDDSSLKDIIERTVTNPTLPGDLTKIGDYAFYYYSNMVLKYLPEGVKTIGAYSFYGCRSMPLASLPEGITTIKTYAFYGCRELSLTSLPKGINTLNSNVFSECDNLALTSLPEGLTSIGINAFSRCPKLAITFIPKGVQSIGHYAFNECIALTTITFKGTPTETISKSAFSGCSNLKTINVPWAEGSVANAPWGAKNATINYNYTGE